MSVLLRSQCILRIPDVLAVALPGKFPGPTSRAMYALPRLPTDANSRSFSGPGSAQLEKPQQKKRSLPYRHSKEEDGTPNNTISDMPVSSDGFNPDHDTLSILEDITMVDSSDLLSAQLPHAHAQDNPKSSDGEDFTTPPTSPSIAETSTEYLIDPKLRNKNEHDRPGLYLQQFELIQLPNFTSRKRPFSEATKSQFPRKASRGETKVQPSTVYNVNSLKPTASTYKLDDPFRVKNDTTSASSRLIAIPGLRRSSTSFDSVSTATTTTTASSVAWSAPRSYASGSTLTTPSTSFRSDSLTTSFTSNNGSFYNAEAPRPVAAPSAVPESNTTIRSNPNTPRAKRRNGPLQRAATTSSAEAQADNADPMEIDRRGFDRRQEVFSELLESPKVRKKIIATNSDADCLPNHLRSLPLLRRSTYRVA